MEQRRQVVELGAAFCGQVDLQRLRKLPLLLSIETVQSFPHFGWWCLTPKNGDLL
jgi:hypothetical protein